MLALMAESGSAHKHQIPQFFREKDQIKRCVLWNRTDCRIWKQLDFMSCKYSLYFKTSRL